MKILSLKNSAPAPLPPGAAVSLGFFDGVHPGHKAIISAARQIADAMGSPCAVWMISLRGEEYKGGAPLLSTESDKLSLLRSAGADYAALSRFEDVRNMTGEEFVRDLLKGTLAVSAVVCGFNFRFGRGAAWDERDLASLCELYGIRCVTVPAVEIGGDSVSSSRIRALIASGKVDRAAELLGRPYSVTLPVLEGKKLGRMLGFPTANQVIPEGLVTPEVGVYAAEVILPNGCRYPGAANVGHCPTVEASMIPERAGDGTATGSRAVCETYIAGFDGNLYGQDIEIRFIKKLRDERKFDSLRELKAQINRDAAESVRLLQG